ncbi:MAG: DUF1565 domain-containing protein, partial [bacterium]|nr:DUF1565 domain-containing protein [bacterium]
MYNHIAYLILLTILLTAVSGAINVSVPDQYPTFAAALSYLNGYGGSHTITLTANGFSEDFTVSPGTWSSLTLFGNGYIVEGFEGNITLTGGPVTITDFYMYNAGTIHCLPGSEGSTIQYCSLWAAGIVVENVSNIAINHNRTWYVDPAVLVKGNGSALITGNGFGIMGFRTGVSIEDSASATITDNQFECGTMVVANTSSGDIEIEDNYTGGYGGGIVYNVSASEDYGIIRNNDFGNAYDTCTFINIVNGSPLIEGNTIINSYDYGVIIEPNANPDMGGGARGSAGNNEIHDNNGGGSGIDVRNNSANDIYCEDNDWGTTTMGMMSGHNYSDTDIDPAIWDHWEDSSKGYIMWNDPGPQAIESASLGEIKAVFSGF